MGKTTKAHKSAGLTVLQTVLLPLIVWLLLEVLCMSLVDQHLIASVADVKTLLRNLITAFAFTLAISANLFCGRMDLSLGAQMYVGVIIGGNIAIMLGWGGLGVLLLAMVISGICGLVIGTMFIHLRILPMVLGLGMTLVFECLCFGINNQQGVTLFGKPGMEVLSNVSFIIVVALSILIVTMYLFQHSSFGYRLRAIQGSQKLANDAGINIYANCVQCYVIAGTLAACAGVFNAAYSGVMTPVMGMSSNGSVFSNMFPLMLGMWIGSICHNQQLGLLLGSLSIRMLIMGLSKLSLGNSKQNVILYSLFLLFTIYNTNKNKFAQMKEHRERFALAQKTKKEKKLVAMA